MSNDGDGTRCRVSSSSTPHSYPLISCPPAWVFPACENDEYGSPQPAEELPYSSSPPNFESSSPQSATSSVTTPEDEHRTASETSESLASTVSAISRRDDSGFMEDRDVHCPLRDEFSTKLNDLLLAVAEERELRPERSWLHETEEVWISTSRDSSLERFVIQSEKPRMENTIPDDRRTSSFVIRWCQDQVSVEGELPKASLSKARWSKSSTLSTLTRSGSGFTSSSWPESGMGYRIIKRSYSTYSQDARAHDMANFSELEPYHKRARVKGNGSTHAKGDTYAQKPASIRRAKSLISRPTDGTTVATTPTTAQIPTEPVTVQSSSPRCRNHVPIIAPPNWLVARLPMSSETHAKIRLGKYLEREGRQRSRDGLTLNQACGVKASSFKDGKEGTRNGDLDDRDTSSESEEDTGETAQDMTFYRDAWTHSHWEMALGLSRKLREKIIDWLLQVLPEHCLRHEVSSQATSASTQHNDSSSTRSLTFSSSNLEDQLATSAETRFHAVWMFLRYFFLVASDVVDPYKQKPDDQINIHSYPKSAEDKDEYECDLAVWDVAITCLALSVKFHRDFLNPLLPVYAHEFLRLAPHDISYEEFETTQRDVLLAFSYRLGVTPQPIFDELWQALPSLQQLLCFDGGWNIVQKETWWRLFDIIYAPDIMRFPQSLLASTALIDAIIACLATRYDFQSNWHNSSIRRLSHRKDAKFNKVDVLQKRSKRLLKRARAEAEGVIQDIQAVIGITDKQLHECQLWWADTIARF